MNYSGLKVTYSDPRMTATYPTKVTVSSLSWSVWSPDDDDPKLKMVTKMAMTSDPEHGSCTGTDRGLCDSQKHVSFQLFCRNVDFYLQYTYSYYSWSG